MVKRGGEGVKQKCVRLGDGGGSGSAVKEAWLSLAWWLQWRHPVLTRGQRSSSPGGCKNVLNQKRFIQQ